MHDPPLTECDADSSRGNELSIDLNGDVGEGIGNDRAFIPLLTSANVSCGGHAGDDRSILEALEVAVESAVQVGAHPGFTDREHYGRREQIIAPQEVCELVAQQVAHLAHLASQVGAAIAYIKPHGALYHQATRDPAIADAVVRAALAFDSHTAIVGPWQSVLEQVTRQAGLRYVCEAFADRAYDSQSLLVPRTDPRAVLTDEDQAIAQTLQIVRDGIVTTIDGAQRPMRAETICLHGDNPQAIRFAQRIRLALQAGGIKLRSFRAVDEGRTSDDG